MIYLAEYTYRKVQEDRNLASIFIFYNYGSLCMNTRTKAETYRYLYRTMKLIRSVEERLARAHMEGLVHGACHTYVGEEAIATGVCAYLQDDDAVFSTHRGHGHAIAKGVSPHALMAELYGRETGCSNGRGGSMHLFAPEIGLMGTSGIVGPCILQAVSAGYAAKLMHTERVGVTFFGDGAVGNGAFHEGLNLAAIYDLPVLFICENNLYATEVSFSYASRNPSVASRADNYGMPGVEVDGNDVLAVYKAAGEAIRRARNGEGPTLIECKTYRMRAHAEGMGESGYRSQEEIALWKDRDPIKTLRDRILEDDLIATDDLKTIEAEIKTIVEEAAQFAADSPWPDGQTAISHVYQEE